MTSMRGTINDYRNREKDIKILVLVIFLFLFLIWLLSPPGNKFAQICYYNNKTQFFIATLTKPKEDLNEWVFHRNNAYYLTLMENKKLTMKEIELAIKTAPNYLSEKEFDQLYSDCGQMLTFFGEHKKALNYYLKIKNPNMFDNFKMALLYKEVGNFKCALDYCKKLFNNDDRAYIAYACYGDVYAHAGKANISVKIFDLLIDKVKNNPIYYFDRANYKKASGDISGYYSDMDKVKELGGFKEIRSTLVENTLNPKKVSLTALKY